MSQCTAHSSQTGERCRKMAIRGADVCIKHGGGAPQVREAARARLAEAQAHEAARRRMVRGQRVEDPIDELRELAAETVAVRRMLAGQMAADPARMAAALDAWGNVAGLLLRTLQAWLTVLPPKPPTAGGPLDPDPVDPERIAAVMRILAGEPSPFSGVVVSEPPLALLAPADLEAAEAPPEPAGDQDGQHSASEPARPTRRRPRPPARPARPPERPVRTGCQHQQVTRFPSTTFGGPEMVTCGHCGGSWTIVEAKERGIWLT